MKSFFSVLIPVILVSMIFASCSKDSPTEPEQEHDFAEDLQKTLDDGLASFHGKCISAAVIMPDGETWA